MIFLVEQMIKNYKDSVRDWEREAEEWAGQSSYRSAYEFKRIKKHPRRKYEIALAVLGYALMLAFIALFVIAITNESVEENRKAQAEENKVLAGKNCKAFNASDKVIIKSGDYTDTSGVIIGGCGKDQEYQVRVDKGEKADLPNDGEDAIDVGGKIVNISTKKDLILSTEK